MTKQDSILAQIAALKTMPVPDLRKQWQQLFDTPPPATTAASWRADWPTGFKN
jgi:hypothetical protein